MARVAEEWLNMCAGCEVAVLDVGESLLDVLPSLDLVHMPVLMDHKYFGQVGEHAQLEIPEADIGLISGSVRTEEERHIAREMRSRCSTLVALGSCACFGGIPALANLFDVGELYDKVYRESETTEPGATPSQDVPPLERRVYALDEVVDVDVYLPGCPVTPALILDALTALLQGKPFALPERSVCDECPAQRERKASVTLRRPLEGAEFVPGEYQTLRCFNEQGVLCLGPVTRSGCGRPMNADEAVVPRCIKGYMPCRGCFGPVRPGADPLVDMMGALASVGVDVKQIADRRALLNRYIGAHDRLAPSPRRAGG
jgi:F420-non-reducing hydrogenase small subunit